MGNGYHAFISYSHRDAAFARWLHTRLETFRFPARLRGIETPLGIVPRSLAPIFRDREEFPAAPDLTSQVREALAASCALVVICSPDSATSPWVNREIEVFRSLHPDRPILAALIALDPASSFPSALVTGPSTEPLAADFRLEGDGRRLGVLKLLSGLSGVPLGDLIQRDAQRHLRRVMAVTATAFVAMAILAAATVTAIRSRDEARRQRAEAEGLVEFMLTDLRTRLKGVGRLDIMSAVNDRANAYYAADHDLSALPAETLERRARLLTAMGEDELQTHGGAASGRAKVAQAYRMTGDLLRREPDNPDRIFNHAQSEYWMGYAAYLQDDKPNARVHLTAYRELAGKLVEANPFSLRWLQELDYAESNLCALALKPPINATAALMHCAAARRVAGGIAARQPHDIDAELTSANRIAWQADAEDAAGHARTALALRREQHALVESMVVRFNGDARVAEARLLAGIGLAKALLTAGKKAEGQERARQAVVLANALRSRDPENRDWAEWKRQAEKLASNF